VFRDGRRSVAGKFLLNGLANALGELRLSKSKQKLLLSCLLWAGELECALADKGSQFLRHSEAITDALANGVIRNEAAAPELLYSVQQIQFDERVSISPPEGFAYYALHPLNFADLARQHARPGELAAVVGIRSIGTTLSAIVAAALRDSGVRAERITVRPTGHPYDRLVQLSAVQREWVSKLSARGASFTVVDEGPGISGSSFLATGESLVRAGAESLHVKFFCSRAIDPAKFVAPNAAERYSRFACFNSPYECRLPERGDIFVGNGCWRQRFLPDTSWPGAWTSMERSKFVSADSQRLFKFHGYGRFGDEVGARLTAIAKAGYGPAYLGSEEGFGCTLLAPGRPATRDDLTRGLINRIAAYCAFRASEVCADHAATDELKKSVEANWEFEFGSKLPIPLELEVVRPVVPDGKMQPHEWIITNDQILKVDAETHGDDHFLPGPTDIAWDLAGAIVEWQMTAVQAHAFLLEYERLSGDDPSSRMHSYLLAYSTFRFAYCKMGAEAMAGTPDESLLTRDYEHYRELAKTHASHDRAQAA